MRDTTFHSVRGLISRAFGIDRKYVTPQTDLTHDLGADSLDRIDIAMELEDEFGVAISNNDALNIETVTDAARLIKDPPPPAQNQE